MTSTAESTVALDLPRRIAAVMAIDPAVEAVEYDGHWSTWGDLTRVGDALDLLWTDVPFETPIAVITRNRPAVVATVLALLARGRVVLVLNGMHPDRTLAEEVASLQPTMVIGATEEWDRTALVDALAQHGVLGVEVPDDLTGATVRIPGDPRRPGVLKSLGEGVAISLQTSGTTGPPKRIEMTYANLVASVEGVTRHYTGRGPGAVKLRSGVAIQMLPLGHTSALLSLTMMAVDGRRMKLLDRFQPAAWAEAVRDHRVAVSGMPPAAIASVLDAKIPREWLASLKAVRAGTAPLDPQLAEAFTREYGIPVIQAYGATEFQGVASWSLRDFEKFGTEKSGSVGRAHPGVELRTVDPGTDEPLNPGEVGILEVRSEQSAGRRPDEWVRTSDLGRVDADQFLWILGRADDVINRGGFKVDAEEVARVLRAHPLVDDAIVVGAPDRRLGSVPVALVASTADPLPGGDELRTWVREHLEAPKVPVRIGVVRELPRNATMKIPIPDVLAAVGYQDGVAK